MPHQLPPEFEPYAAIVPEWELDEIAREVPSSGTIARSDNRFRRFTDALINLVTSENIKRASDGLLSLISHACYLRGRYDLNQILAGVRPDVVCETYAVLSRSRQSIDPSLPDILRGQVDRVWDAQRLVEYAGLLGETASVLIDMGHLETAEQMIHDGMERLISAPADQSLREAIQKALLKPRILLAQLAILARKREEAIMRLDSAEVTADRLGHELALSDIRFLRALILHDARDDQKALSLADSVCTSCSSMGYLHGLCNAMNLRGLIHLTLGDLQDAKDEFEELLNLCHLLNNQLAMVRTLVNIGEAERQLNNMELMEDYNEQARKIGMESGYVRGAALATMNLGDAAAVRGDLHRAIQLYEEARVMAERAGHRGIVLISMLQRSDVSYLLGWFEEVAQIAREVRSVAERYRNPFFVFLTDVDEAHASWALGRRPDGNVLKHLRAILGAPQDWSDESCLLQMREARRRAFEDKSIESTACIFYDQEMNFVCRADRSTLRKECLGNILWSGSLCPYLSSFVERVHAED
ncbi:MAG: hypothetical protein QXS20_04840 [Candidatus Thorarchaeota archaeon]